MGFFAIKSWGNKASVSRIFQAVAAALVLNLTAACGAEETNKAGRNAGLHKVLPDMRKSGFDAEFRPFVDVFENESGLTLGDIPVNFGDTSDWWEFWAEKKNVAAVCALGVDGRREIVVNRQIWEQTKAVSPELLEGIVAHEIGHCKLQKNHNPATMTVKVNNREYETPYSLMYPVAEFFFYKNFKKHYLDELLSRGAALSGDDADAAASLAGAGVTAFSDGWVVE